MKSDLNYDVEQDTDGTWIWSVYPEDRYWEPIDTGSEDSEEAARNAAEAQIEELEWAKGIEETERDISRRIAGGRW